MANKDFYDGKWHATIPFEDKANADDVGMIDMVGVNPKDIRQVKINHWRLKALIVEVNTEEEYREIMKPIREELRKKSRHKRCLIPDGKGASMRCPCNRDCATCEYKHAGYTCPESLDQYDEDAGFEAAADENLDPSRLYEQKSFITELDDYISKLCDEEQLIARAILSKRPDKEVMAELGIEKQSTYSSRKIKVKKKLQIRFANWL